MTKHDALRAARALLDGMAGTTEGEWHTGPSPEHPADHECAVYNEALDLWPPDAAHIARSCPARLGPVLRALMEGE